jgi:membrane dipeptidase
MKEGGVNAQFFACCVDPGYPRQRWAGIAEGTLRAVADEADRQEDLSIALSGSGIRTITSAGGIAVLLSVEGGHTVPSLAALERFYRIGMRSMAVTWKNSNEMADSSEGSRRWGGLSSFGRETVREMDRLGIIIDCSHASRESFFDILDITSNPVILSHSCAAGICDIPRNTDDSQLKALAGNGGVICINFFPAFLDMDSHTEIMKVWSVYRSRKSELSRKYGGDPGRAGAELLPEAMRGLSGISMPPLSRVADHIDYAVERAGVDHVGIGSDFDGIPVTPAGLEDISRLPALEKELSGRGYTAGQIDKILGENLLRVTETVCG